MDFKSRNPNLKRWSKAKFGELVPVFPYDHLTSCVFHHLNALDYSTSFLVLIGDFSEDESEWYAYGVEAPADSTVRKLFEDNKLSWTDFMAHRNWVIEFTVQFGTDEDVAVRYISPSDIEVNIVSELKKLDRIGGPYQIVHDLYLKQWEWEKKYRPEEHESRDDYHKIVQQIGHRLNTFKNAG